MGGVTAVVGGVTAVVGGVTAAVGGVTAAVGGVTAAVGGVTAAVGGVTAAVGGVTAAVGVILPVYYSPHSFTSKWEGSQWVESQPDGTPYVYQLHPVGGPLYYKAYHPPPP